MQLYMQAFCKCLQIVALKNPDGIKKVCGKPQISRLRIFKTLNFKMRFGFKKFTFPAIDYTINKLYTLFKYNCGFGERIQVLFFSSQIEAHSARGLIF